MLFADDWAGWLRMRLAEAEAEAGAEAGLRLVEAGLRQGNANKEFPPPKKKTKTGLCGHSSFLFFF